MKSRAALGVLAMIGMLALSATVAHAGGHGSPIALTSFFVCHQVNGAYSGRQVDVQSDNVASGDAVRTLVTIGQAVLACAQAALVEPGTNNPPQEIYPNFPPLPAQALQAQDLKCYTAFTQKKSGESAFFDVEDKLTSTETVPVFRDIKLVCGPAIFR